MRAVGRIPRRGGLAVNRGLPSRHETCKRGKGMVGLTGPRGLAHMRRLAW